MKNKEKVKTFFVCYKKVMILSFLIIGTLMICFINGYSAKEKEDDIVIQNVEETKEEVNEEIYIDVKGEVKKSGVYKVDSNSRIIDVLNKAGLTKNSNTFFLNLSAKVIDESVIYVFSNDEIEKIVNRYTSDKVCDYIENNYCINIKENTNSVYTNTTDSSVYTNLEKEENNEEKTIININTASIEELTSLEGIGESKAKSIIEYRTNTGLFKSIDEITNVSGIGESLFEKIKEDITV